ncbi:MAG: hypothetical protein ACRDY0_02290 [Acidimicrobiales bacterium]
MAGGSSGTGTSGRGAPGAAPALAGSGATAPGAPTSVSAALRPTSAQVSWSAPG